MSDIPCSHYSRHSYICKINIYQNKDKKDEMKMNCPENFNDISYNNSCYHYERAGGSALTWYTAEKMCKKFNSTLARFETKEEWEAVMKELVMMRSGYAWIGGEANPSGSEKFQWGDGMMMETGVEKKFGWVKSEPVNLGYDDCVATGTTPATGEYGWSASECLYARPFLCEYNKTLFEASSLGKN
jgi:hypothetical protein